MARGYVEEANAVRESGRWEAVSGSMGPGMRLDARSRLEGLEDEERCQWLGYGVGYYLEGGV
jgi:hypothetical protein